MISGLTDGGHANDCLRDLAGYPDQPQQYEQAALPSPFAVLAVIGRTGCTVPPRFLVFATPWL